MPAAIRYRFGPFVLDPAIRQLAREGVPITLPPKAFDILVLLVRTRERVVPKQELLDAVWPDTAVIENTLTQRIGEIRDALGDEAKEPRWVKTVSRVGYRFVGEVVEESEPPSHAAREPIAPEPVRASREDAAAPLPVAALTETAGAESPWRARRAAYAAVLALVALGGFGVWSVGTTRPAPPVSEPRIESIAVLPLENLSRDPDQDYFADGMTDELIAELARNPALRVISRTSAVRYKASTKSLREIGRELNVDAIVEGSVLRAGSRLESR